MLSKEVLQSLCGDPDRPYLSKPFSFKLDDVWWNGATNGHALIAEVALGGADYVREDSPPVAQLFRKDKPSHVARFGLLAKWCGKCEQTRVCKDCNGTGVHSCNCSYCEVLAGSMCPACEGDKTFKNRLAVDFEHVQFDRVLAARYLAPFADCAEEVPTFVGDELEPIEFRGTNWRVVMMPLKRHVQEPATASVPEGLIRKAP